MYRNIKRYLSLIIILVLSCELAYSQYEQYYDVLPDIPNCETGTLKQSEKDKMLEYLNRIRDLHKLPHFEYDASFDKNAMEISLICAANGQLSHTPDESWHCWSQDGLNGGLSTNLFLGSGTSYASEVSVVSWMNDRNQIELGHRRWIINPFVKKIAFGRVDGIPIEGSHAVSAMAFYYDSQTNANLSTVPNDFVACPYGDYPPNLWDFGWSILSFSVLENKNNRLANDSSLISYASTLNGEPVNEVYVEVEDEAGNITTYGRGTGLGWAYDGYGLPNYCYWQIHGLEEQKVYKVRIYDVLVNGQSKNFSYEFAFRDPFITKPGACVLSQPQDDAADVNPNVRFEWGTAQGADKYILEIAENSGFSQSEIIYRNDKISATSYQVSGVLEPMKEYYWRIAGMNDAGRGDWSPVWSFTTTTAPDAPTLAGPADNATEVSLTPTLTWNEADKADKYQVQVSDGDSFGNLLVDVDDVPNTSYTVENDVLGTETEYFWKVRSISDISGSSAWSDTRNFTTATAAPGRPDLLSPAQGAKDQSALLGLQWSNVPGAASYNLQICSETNWPDWAIVLDETGIEITYFKVPFDKMLELETLYFWRVSANGPGGTSDWSKNGRFTVGDASPVEDTPVYSASIEVYPNPVTDMATINISMLQKEFVTMRIFNALGEETAVIVNAELIPGEYIINFDSSTLPSGFYYYQLSGTETNISGKINIIR
ncbi:CAP domain-containing protein [Bacteroidota bacterium]